MTWYAPYGLALLCVFLTFVWAIRRAGRCSSCKRWRSDVGQPWGVNLWIWVCVDCYKRHADEWRAEDTSE